MELHGHHTYALWASCNYIYVKTQLRSSIGTIRIRPLLRMVPQRRIYGGIVLAQVWSQLVQIRIIQGLTRGPVKREWKWNKRGIFGYWLSVRRVVLTGWTLSSFQNLSVLLNQMYQRKDFGARRSHWDLTHPRIASVDLHFSSDFSYLYLRLSI